MGISKSLENSTMIENDQRVLSFISSQILGDGSLGPRSIQITHGYKWRDYLEVKINLAKQLGLNVSEVRQ